MTNLEQEKASGEKKIPEAIKGLQAFRKSSDLEQFYRFIHENSLRKEAHRLLEYILHKMKGSLAPKKRAKKKGKRKTKKLQ